MSEGVRGGDVYGCHFWGEGSMIRWRVLNFL